MKRKKGEEKPNQRNEMGKKVMKGTERKRNRRKRKQKQKQKMLKMGKRKK